MAATSGAAKLLLTGEPGPLVVRVTNRAGVPLAGVAVTFSIARGGGSLSETSTTTGSAGTAATTYTAGEMAGVASIGASAAALVSQSVDVVVEARRAAALVIVSGANQSIFTGSTAPAPLVVSVRDQRNDLLPGAPVAFVAAGTGNLVSASRALTDANGRAQVTYMAGETPGFTGASAALDNGARVHFAIELLGGTTGPCATQATTTTKAVCYAYELFGTLTAVQRAMMQQPYALALAQRWSPAACVSPCRNGVELGALSPVQVVSALKLIEATLGEAGYATFAGVRRAEMSLARQGGPTNGDGEGRYAIAVLGNPSTGGEWMVQVGGHNYA